MNQSTKETLSDLNGERVEIYRNLHRNCFSIRHRGRVIAHLMDDDPMQLVLRDVQYVVQPAGHAKVLRKRQKNVHAFVRGTIARMSWENIRGAVSYNPYKSDSFQVTRLAGHAVITSSVAAWIHGGIIRALGETSADVPHYYSQNL